jgi:hypothetical protein
MSLKSIRVALAGLALLGLGGQASGPRPATASPQTAPATAAPQAPAPSAAPAASPSPAAPGKDPLVEFVPKERVPADSAVSFPVDI